MMSRRYATLVATLGAALALLASCGGGTDRTKAQLRLVNASGGYAGLDFAVNGTVLEGNVGYGTNPGYVEVDPGNAATTISSAGSGTALLSFTPAVSKNSYYTLLAYGGAGALSQLPLDENSGAPDSGKALLRVVNSAPDAGSLDVYLTGSSDLLAASVPVLTGASVGTLGGWVTVTATTWRLRITANGSKTDLRLDLPAFALASQQIATLVLTPGSGGVLVNALLVTQQAGVTRLDGNLVRVRVAAGLAAGGAVSATVGGTALMTGVGSPAVGLYALLPAGAQTVVVTANAASVPTTPTTLAAGGDYTLLVYGPPAAAKASWITDDNRLPSDATKAKIRLVDGLPTLATPLAMTVDFVPVADSVAPGLASGYAFVPPSTTSALSVTASGLAAPLFAAGTQTFVAGANYTLFVVGDDAAPTGILRKDR
jgi:hypothetical protein